MSGIKILYDIRHDIQDAVVRIKIANDYNTAEAIYRMEFDKITALYENNCISSNSYSIYTELLDKAMTT